LFRVTGVQTCALPISKERLTIRRRGMRIVFIGRVRM
jgi:hypothetical protein